MPEPRVTGQAILTPLSLTRPGFLGLNTDMESAILDPQWATKCTNAVFDDQGRLSSRAGFTSSTSTPAAGVIKRIHEFTKATGVTEIISSTDADIFTGLTAPSSIEGTLGVTDGNIKFVNFSDDCIAFGIGTAGIPVKYTGTGNFTDITVATGSAPTGTIGTSAFGRLWVSNSDGKTISYSALQDETKWATADGGGTIDMSKVWGRGQDVIVAIEEFGGDLIVFGRNQIIIWSDNSGSDFGITPTDLYISDTIIGTGALSQFAIERVEGDLWFVTPRGIDSLYRARTERTTPTRTITDNVEGDVRGYLTQESDYDNLTLTYDSTNGRAYLVFPTSDRQFVFEGRGTPDPLTGAEIFPCTQWVADVQTLMYAPQAQVLYGSLTGTVGEIMTNTGSSDDGADFTFTWESGWMDLGQQAATYYKWLKKILAIVEVSASTTLTYSVYYDFQSQARTTQVAVTASGSAEWSLGEFNLDEFSGGGGVDRHTAPMFGGGQYIKIGLSAATSGGTVAVQLINLFAKLGRIANV